MTDVLGSFVDAARAGLEADVATVGERPDGGRDFDEVWHRAHDEYRLLSAVDDASAEDEPRDDAEASLDAAVNAIFAEVARPPNGGEGARSLPTPADAGVTASASSATSAPPPRASWPFRLVAGVAGAAALAAFAWALGPERGWGLGEATEGSLRVAVSAHDSGISRVDEGRTVSGGARLEDGAPPSFRSSGEAEQASATPHSPALQGDAAATSMTAGVVGADGDALPQTSVARDPQPSRAQRWQAPLVAADASDTSQRAELRTDVDSSKRRRRHEAGGDADPVAALEEQAQRAWQEGRLEDADAALREIIASATSRRRVELAWGDRFTLARRIGGRMAEVELWRAYLAARPRGWHADDARAGLCRTEDDGEARRACWCEYAEAFPEGAHAARARDACE